MSVRKLKVYRGHNNQSYKPQPLIRLCGDYLARLGFTIGDYVEIRGGNGVITITNHATLRPSETDTGSAEAQPARDSLA